MASELREKGGRRARRDLIAVASAVCMPVDLCPRDFGYRAALPNFALDSKLREPFFFNTEATAGPGRDVQSLRPSETRNP